MFSLDTGGLHSLFALLAFVFFNLEAIGSATRLTGMMKLISILAGSIGLVFIVLMIVGDAGNTAAFGPINRGGTERDAVPDQNCFTSRSSNRTSWTDGGVAR